MHPQNTDTDKDVDDTTGKGRETERLEQDEILQGMHAKHADAEEQLARVRARIDEVGEKRAVTEEAIYQARAIYEQIQGCSPGEATRLQRRVLTS